MVIDWVMRHSTTGRLTFTKQLEDLNFADDKHQDAQEKLNRVDEEDKKTGLKINKTKTEIMRVNK
jgi:hypothetical protein